MEETLVFIDEGFLDKLTKLFGDGKRIKYDKFDFAKRIAKKQNLICEHVLTNGEDYDFSEGFG